MKKGLAKLLGFAFGLCAVSANGLDTIEVGTINKGGSGCYNSKAKAVVSGNRLFVPLSLLHSKVADNAIERSNCAIVLPIQAREGTRLKLKDPFIQGDVAIRKQTKLSINVEVFSPDQKGEKMNYAISTAEQSVQKRIYLNSEDELVTECGGSVMLRVNSSATVTSKTGTKSRASVDWLRMNLVEEVCN